MPKDSKKKIWEKERRDHLKEAFLKLEKLLPSYDPSSSASRIDVLTKSIEYIQEMKTLVQELSNAKSEFNPKVLKLKNLQDRIKRLVSRMDILSRLLREAKIPIPNARSWEEFKDKNYKWSGRLNVNTVSVMKAKMMKKNINDQKNKNIPPTGSVIDKKTEKHGKNIKSQIRNEFIQQKPLQPATSNCLIIYTQGYNTSPCYLVTNTTANNIPGSSQTVLTNSLLASSPTMTTTVKGGEKALLESKSIGGGGGALILTNGSIYPVLQPTQHILSTPMVLQVASNPKPINMEQKNEKNKKDDEIERKSSKKNLKKSVIKKSTIKSTSNNGQKSNLQVCTNSKILPNILPCRPNIITSKNAYLIPTPKILIPNPTNIIRPKTILTGITRRRVAGKRIGDKPVSRQALRGIGRMARKKDMEEKAKMIQNLKDISPSSEKDNNSSQKAEHTDVDKNEGNNILKTEHSNTSADVKIHHSSTEKAISIISDDVIKPSDNKNNSSDTDKIRSAYDISADALQTCQNDNEILETNEGQATDELKQSDSLIVDNSVQDLNLGQNGDQAQTSDNPDNSAIIVNLNKNQVSKNIEHNHSEKLSIDDATVQDSEQNVQSENTTDLENVCSVNQQLKSLDIHLGHSELSNDIFASLQVPPGCQNPESTSPTAAFLLAFPLVSSLTGVKVTEVMDEENPDSQRETPTLLQIGTMDNTKSGQSESFNSNLLNIDFFSSKDIYSGFYNSFEQHLSSLTVLQSNITSDSSKIAEKNMSNSKFGDNFKSSNISQNIEAPIISKRNSGITQIPATNNENFSSSDMNCEPRFTFEEKQLDAVTICEENKAKVSSSSTTYLHESIEHVENKELQEKNDNTGKNNVVKPHLSTQLDQNVQSLQSKVEFVKDAVSKVKTSPSKSANSVFMKNESCDNIFNVGNANNTNSNTHKNNEPIMNMNFYPEKQKLMISDQFNVENSVANNTMQPLYQVNIHEAQMPFISNKNFGEGSLAFGIDNNSFTSKNMHNKDTNFNVMNEQANPSQKTLIQPYFMPDNTSYQSISTQNNNKTLNVENRNTETQKYFNYNSFISDAKKPQKSNEMNFDFHLGNKVAPVSKNVELKEVSSSFNIIYQNSIYDINNITKICTCAYNSNKITSEPLYTNSNSNNYNYYSNSESYLNEICYKNTKNDKHPVSDSETTYTNYKKNEFNHVYYPDNSKKNIPLKSENTQEKSTYNWMTTPAKPTSNNNFSAVPKNNAICSNTNLISGNQNSYFNPAIYTSELNTNLGQTSKKTFDLPLMNTNYQKPDVDEGQNQFSWSPTKMPQFLDPVPSFVSSTLPTLVGDLALGSSNFTEQKYEFTSKCTKEMKSKAAVKLNYENQNNFFSVSQLVHDKSVPAKTSRRRNSATASKSNQIKSKKAVKGTEDQKECFNKSPGSQNLAKVENKNYNYRQAPSNTCEKRSPMKMSSSIYSAEALISQHGHSENNSKKDQVFTGNPMKNIPVPPYIPDNIMPYFPTVDIQSENIGQQNQNYQNFPNFTTFSNSTYSNNTFMPTSTITTPYISSSTFVSDIGNVNEFSSENIGLFPNTSINKMKLPTKHNLANREDKSNPNNPCILNVSKKVKRKPPNEINVAPNLADFPFLSVPGSINSPLLPDDFHTHSTYLPPPPTQPQLYPCKNTLYSAKQNTMTSTAPLLPLPPIPITRSGIQHPDISPSLNSVGTSSLTNFNLSTIFPEINKSSMADIYSENQPKDPGVNRNYSNSSVTFNTKPTFTYPNCPITQPYGIDNR